MAGDAFLKSLPMGEDALGGLTKKTAGGAPDIGALFVGGASAMALPGIVGQVISMKLDDDGRLTAENTWALSAQPVLSAGLNESFDGIAVKDPSVVFFEGMWRVPRRGRQSHSALFRLFYIGNPYIMTTHENAE